MSVVNKNQKYIRIIFLLVCVFVPLFLFASGGEVANEVKFVKGNGLLEEWFMNGFRAIDLQMNAMAERGTILGRVIAGLGALITLGWMGFQMQSGDTGWEIMPMIKPFLIGLIILNWSAFYHLIQDPLEKLAEGGESIFENMSSSTTDLRNDLYTKKMEYIDIVINERAKIERLQGIQPKTSLIGMAWDAVASTVGNYFEKMQYKMQLWSSQVMEVVGLGILRVCTYLIFFIQKIWSYVLIVLGPLAFGLALFPGFNSSMISWISKFINVNLYTFVAFTIINIGHAIIMAAYNMQISRLDTMINNAKFDDFAQIAEFQSAGGMMFASLWEIVAYAVTGIGMLMVPTISDSVISAGGAMIMSKAKGGVGKMMSGAKGGGNVMKKGGKIGLGGIKGGIKGGMSGAKSGMAKGGAVGGPVGGVVGGIAGGVAGAVGGVAKGAWGGAKSTKK